ncbi:hypothetical protein PISMIDRAFT_671885 [Pisolithus microcarpus 441]|uniref:Uncharacterized protein n=1 Tax=Pisolithus microcarpus 441 TaxID=765257 RepID=A0A0D0A629_9AGAM|nr:hypothetical protein PISMIDRAFT_671885 [Pisolithus microcarpus 441]
MLTSSRVSSFICAFHPRTLALAPIVARVHHRDSRGECSYLCAWACNPNRLAEQAMQIVDNL